MKLNKIHFALVKNKDGEIVNTCDSGPIIYEDRITVLSEWDFMKRLHPGHYLQADYSIIEVVLRKSGTFKAKERREAQKKGTQCSVQ